jgi:hypothetical protein
MMYALGVKYKKNADGFFSSILLFILTLGRNRAAATTTTWIDTVCGHWMLLSPLRDIRRTFRKDGSGRQYVWSQ